MFPLPRKCMKSKLLLKNLNQWRKFRDKVLEDSAVIVNEPQTKEAEAAQNTKIIKEVTSLNKTK